MNVLGFFFFFFFFGFGLVWFEKRARVHGGGFGARRVKERKGKGDFSWL